MTPFNAAEHVSDMGFGTWVSIVAAVVAALGFGGFLVARTASNLLGVDQHEEE